MATFVLQAITGAHTPTCLLCRNRSRRNRDAPTLDSSLWFDEAESQEGASQADRPVLQILFYASLASFPAIAQPGASFWRALSGGGRGYLGSQEFRVCALPPFARKKRRMGHPASFPATHTRCLILAGIVGGGGGGGRVHIMGPVWRGEVGFAAESSHHPFLLRMRYFAAGCDDRKCMKSINLKTRALDNCCALYWRTAQARPSGPLTGILPTSVSVLRSMTET